MMMLLNAEKIRVGYVLKRFPRLSETFILNELIALQSMGVDLDVYSLLQPSLEKKHGRLQLFNAPLVDLSRYEKSSNLDLHYGIEGKAIAMEQLLHATDSPLFSGYSESQLVTLYMKAAAIALRAQSRNIRHLHAHFASDAATVALLAARMMRGTFSFTAHARDIYHTYVSEEADNEMRRMKIREAEFVLTVSDYNVEYLRGLCPESADRIFRLYNGIDLSFFEPVSRKRQIPGRFIAVGRLVEKKGFSVLIEACSRLQKWGLPVDCRIVGDGPLRDSLCRLIHKHKLQHHVHLTGALEQEELVDLMQTASLAVLPCVVTESGDRDGLPTVLLEAMAMGLPVVTTEVSGGPEIVSHYKSGLLCPPGDARLLSTAIETILQNPSMAHAMGREGRILAQERFDLYRNVGMLKEHFASLGCRFQGVRGVA